MSASIAHRFAPAQSIVVVLVAAVAFASAFAVAQAAPSAAPSQVPAWQTAAGGKMEFEVASIRRSEPGTFLHPDIVLNNEETPVPPGGQFVADFPLQIFLEFAYKIMPTQEQEEAMLAHLPKWVSTDHFVIRAQFAGSPSKDQIRLMMQSLLAERFKLTAHFESKVHPALALVFDKAGMLGPRIRVHADGPACDAPLTIPTDRTSPSVPPGAFVPLCGLVQAIDGLNHTILVGARNITLDHLAGYLPDFEDIGRPIVDQTGLGGTFDFSLSWVHEHAGGSPTDLADFSDTQGPSFLEALKDQLGLKLKPTRAPVQTLVIDHIERLSPN